MTVAAVGIAAFAAGALTGMTKPPAVLAQSVASTPKFEVASVKPCQADIPPGVRAGGGNSSPERLSIQCQTVKGLINIAYVLFADGTANVTAQIPIEGGPSWINSGRYTIEATTQAPEKIEMMQGPMLQALLEDRFGLRIHREAREVAVYELTVAKGGPKLKPFKKGSCVPMDFLSLSKQEIAALSPDVNYCRNQGTFQDGIITVDSHAMSLDDFCQRTLRDAVDRPIVNKTEISGLFDFHLEYVPDGNSPLFRHSDSDPIAVAGPSIFTALQEQLGLKLQSARAAGELLVIDRVNKPSPN
ncbi:MAG TPA: TIGR03435 family protein [Candidatus Aquilonibacter sp.]|nr:TIGR03435 family protein [Candidatus Aquilonibacter sp.]